MLLLVCLVLSLLMLACIDLGSYLLGRRGWARFLSSFLLFYAQIIVTEFFLGALSILTSPTLIVLNLLVSGGVLYLLSKRFGTKKCHQYPAALRASWREFWTQLRGDPLWSVLLALAVIFVGWVVFLGIIFPATDFDGNSYHLTFAAQVVQNHNFFDVPTSLTWLNGYPKGGEFMQMWSLLISHNDLVTDLTQVPFALLAVYALYSLAVTLGAAKRQARFSALLFVFLPIVLNQLKTTYVDVMLCALFFAGLAQVARRRLGQLDLLLVGIIFSLLISVKSTGFLFVAALTPLLVWNVYTGLKPAARRVVKSYLKPALLIIAPMAFGAYWYIKDYIFYGSPIYPFGFKLAGISIFPGKTFQEFAAAAVGQLTALPHGSLSRIWFVWTEQKDWFGCLYNYDTNYAGFGPVWFIVLLPAILVAGYRAVRRGNRLALAVGATIIGLFAIYPSDYYTRYTIFVTALGVLALSLILTHIHKLAANLVKLLSILLVLSVIGTNFVLCNYPPGLVKDQLKSFIHGDERGPAYSGTLGVAFTTIESDVQPGDVVAYDSSPYFIYPLWRPDFKDRVIYIPAKSSASWYQQLARDHVRYVFTTINSKENRWAHQHGTHSIYKDVMYEIFKVY